MKLILFFNGWGMDNKNIEKITLPQNYQIKIINFPYIVKDDFSTYEEIIPIGWSFGCYYLTKYILENSLSFKKIIALNGHGDIVGDFGIAPKMLNLTLDTLTPETLLKFYQNMGIDNNFINPSKNFKEIKYELQYFKDNFIPLKNIFTHAFIGKNDKIVPASRQKKLFLKDKIPFIELEATHYLFSNINNWNEIIERRDDEFYKNL